MIFEHYFWKCCRKWNYFHIYMFLLIVNSNKPVNRNEINSNDKNHDNSNNDNNNSCDGF